jgi:asparagine synthase (glutamine-hydrolysing)
MDSRLRTNSCEMHLHLRGLFGQWTRFQHLWLNGIPFLGNQRLDAEQAYQLVADSISRGDVGSLLRRLNGFFCFVFQTEDSLYLASDRIRSRPLFYSTIEAQLRVSDCARWLRGQLPESTPDALAAEEFLRAGYVTGGETLIAGIRQLQAAEALKLSEKGVIDRIGYYQFTPENPEHGEEDLEFWLKKTDRALRCCIDRMIDLARGRQIVIPLSGGYDSRAIAAYLKQSGYGPLTAFTFGKRTSPEVVISRRVAQDLGLDWHFVPYTRATWARVGSSDWFKDCCLLIHSLVSVPNVMLVPAIEQLIQRGVIQTDGIVVPGHTGDFVSGGHMPRRAFRDQFVFDRLAATMFVLRRHFGQRKRRPLSIELVAKVDSQTLRLWEKCPADWSDKQKFLAVCDAWNHRERQAKFIANSNRYYDYFGLGWWMPFWDWQFLEAWQETPLGLRKNERLWIELIDRKMKSLVGTHAVYGHASKDNSRLTRAFYRTFDYFVDPNYLFDLVPFHRWMLSKVGISKKDGSVFGYLSERTLDWTVRSN